VGVNGDDDEDDVVDEEEVEEKRDGNDGFVSHSVSSPIVNWESGRNCARKWECGGSGGGLGEDSPVMGG
jgi:hypothetical protein